MNTTEFAPTAAPKAPNIGRGLTGWGVGMEALGFPVENKKRSWTRVIQKGYSCHAWLADFVFLWKIVWIQQIILNDLWLWDFDYFRDLGKLSFDTCDWLSFGTVNRAKEPPIWPSCQNAWLSCANCHLSSQSADCITGNCFPWFLISNIQRTNIESKMAEYTCSYSWSY